MAHFFAVDFSFDAGVFAFLALFNKICLAETLLIGTRLALGYLVTKRRTDASVVRGYSAATGAPLERKSISVLAIARAAKTKFSVAEIGTGEVSVVITISQDRHG